MSEESVKNIYEEWSLLWPEALKVWSDYTRLASPIWCWTSAEQLEEGLTGSFAMIRLNDLKVVLGLKQIEEKGLAPFGLQIMAHEVGHHVFSPANLRDNARLAARIQRGLPGYERYTGLVSNLYSDLLINDRLQRDFGLDMVSVYKKLKSKDESPLWTLYLRMDEMLWGLPVQTLTTVPPTPSIQGDADLGARLIRAYSTEWLDGGGRFACLLLPYLEEEPDKERVLLGSIPPWLDTIGAGEGDTIPDGLIELDDGELEAPVHPSEDNALNGLYTDMDNGDEGNPNSTNPHGGDLDKRAPNVNRHRSPAAYTGLLKALGVTLSEKELVMRYYREQAIPHIVSFPSIEMEQARDPLPEGLQQWDIGSSVSDIDWTESLIQSPLVIPGLTTVERTYGYTEGSSPETVPLDLYLGIDCSGSMPNPSRIISYPIIAGTIMTISALRAKAKVMACLSGESPGKYSQTNGFLSSEREIMKVLTGYLGTGYAFGIRRLEDAFLKGQTFTRNTHIIVLTDSDLFSMLNGDKDGWDIAQKAAQVAGGGATACLNIARTDWYKDGIQRLQDIGWNVHLVPSMKDVVTFARAFSKANYEKKGRK